jgi:hypothetical protein
MNKFFRSLALVTLALAVALPAFSQGRGKKNSEASTRSVEGFVSDDAGKSVAGAAVHLKNTKTLQIRSFITKEDGSYSFQGLGTNVDYELKAEWQGASSDVKTLSVFDSRAKANINLKLKK